LTQYPAVAYDPNNKKIAALGKNVSEGGLFFMTEKGKIRLQRQTDEAGPNLRSFLN